MKVTPSSGFVPIRSSVRLRKTHARADVRMVSRRNRRTTTEIYIALRSRRRGQIRPVAARVITSLLTLRHQDCLPRYVTPSQHPDVLTPTNPYEELALAFSALAGRERDRRAGLAADGTPVDMIRCSLADGVPVWRCGVAGGPVGGRRASDDSGDGGA
jgi:hypothetical protein